MTLSVSILMAFDCKCKYNLFTHEHFAGAHTFHVELNTLNQKTACFCSTYLLISNNSNWIGALGAKSLLYGVGKGGTYTNPKELKGRLLFTGDTFFIF